MAAELVQPSLLLIQCSQACCSSNAAKLAARPMQPNLLLVQCGHACCASNAATQLPAYWRMCDVGGPIQFPTLPPMGGASVSNPRVKCRAALSSHRRCSNCLSAGRLMAAAAWQVGPSPAAGRIAQIACFKRLSRPVILVVPLLTKHVARSRWLPPQRLKPTQQIL